MVMRPDLTGHGVAVAPRELPVPDQPDGARLRLDGHLRRHVGDELAKPAADNPDQPEDGDEAEDDEQEDDLDEGHGRGSSHELARQCRGSFLAAPPLACVSAVR
jgi:hypothetical protein